LSLHHAIDHLAQDNMELWPATRILQQEQHSTSWQANHWLKMEFDTHKQFRQQCEACACACDAKRTLADHSKPYQSKKRGR
jgi:hypothetical protein